MGDKKALINNLFAPTSDNEEDAKDESSFEYDEEAAAAASGQIPGTVPGKPTVLGGSNRA